MEALAIPERFVDVAGTQIRYLDVGTGTPLILLHGLGHSSTAWRRAIDRLAKRHRVLVPDFPGFGGSDAPLDARYDPPYFARITIAFVDALSLGEVDAAGHSGGGLVLLVAALGAPKRFRKIVLADPAGFTPAPDNLLGTAAASLVRLLVSMPRNRALIRALYATAFYDSNAVDEETVDELVRRRTNPRAKSAAKRAFTTFFDFCRHLGPFHTDLSKIDAPVLIVWGADDLLFRANDASVAERVLRRARIERFERCGHCPQIECPDRFTDLIVEFLAAT